ncbi:unnamed protein product [Darwinula stevensoni]|uniref:Uncharacterized protein n=1 Tax=Darwinula stevensoni TaxID=69355 RepID=A0A7R9AAF9_9CRUS|nr:unnamed protein product [Darwinula stevensoni]CAG0898431.1 unnamed protein product [Darwinula stevensoni]
MVITEGNEKLVPAQGQNEYLEEWFNDSSSVIIKLSETISLSDSAGNATDGSKFFLPPPCCIITDQGWTIFLCLLFFISAIVIATVKYLRKVTKMNWYLQKHQGTIRRYAEGPEIGNWKLFCATALE